MNKISLKVRLLAVLLSGFLFAPCHLVVLAANPGATDIDHSPPGNYYPGFRINLYADIEDDTGILLARCYFKTKYDKNFAFVDMVAMKDNLYQAQLPAPWVNSESVDYLFVAINNLKDVTRSPLYSISEERTREAAVWKQSGEVFEVRLDQYQEVAEKYQVLKDQIVEKYKNEIPDWQTADSREPVKVKTDIGKESTQLEGFFDRVIVEEAQEPISLASQGEQITTAGSVEGSTAETTTSISELEQTPWSSDAATAPAASGGTGFWSGPWPWVIGGVLVAGGAGVAIASASGGGGGDGTTPCNTTTQAGGDTPETHTYAMGQSSGTFRFDYDSATQKDRFIIKYEGATIFNSGCVGTGTTRTVYVSFAGSSNNITVTVEPNCEGGSGTWWEYTVYCP